jgi:endoglucanase
MILRAALGGLALAALMLPAEAAELVKNGSFTKGVDPWWPSGAGLKLAPGNGELCMAIPGGTSNVWDVLVGQNDIPLKQGSTYTFSFHAQSEMGGPILGLVQMPKPPWTPYASLSETATPKGATFTQTFTAPETQPAAQVVFQIGGAPKPWVLCLDDVSVRTGK